MRYYCILGVFCLFLALSANAVTEEQAKAAPKKARKPVHTLTLEGARIVKRDCFNHFFEIVINNESYLILYNNIEGDEIQKGGNAMMLCNRHRQGFYENNIVNVRGILIESNGQKALYNAAIFSVPDPKP